MKYRRIAGDLKIPGQFVPHPTVTEERTGVVACGHSWCRGDCGLPALAVWPPEPAIENLDGLLKAHGVMVASGPAFQKFRVRWRGEVIPAALTLDEVNSDELWNLWWS